MTRRRILISAGTIAALMILFPPWQEPVEWTNDDFIGWRPLLRPPQVSVPILDYQVRQGYLPPDSFHDPEIVARHEGGFVAIYADIAWDVLVTQWLALGVCAVGCWFATTRAPKGTTREVEIRE